MSRFITDEDLEAFVRDVLQEEPRRKETAMRIADAIAADKIYEERAKCSCQTNCCKCLLPMELVPDKIQAGDTFRQVTPEGREMTLGALGVRDRRDGRIEIFTAGWPPMIVQIPAHGTAHLVRKGPGITKEELRHRRAKVGGAWDDGL